MYIRSFERCLLRFPTEENGFDQIIKISSTILKANTRRKVLVSVLDKDYGIKGLYLFSNKGSLQRADHWKRTTWECTKHEI